MIRIAQSYLTANLLQIQRADTALDGCAGRNVHKRRRLYLAVRCGKHAAARVALLF